MKIYCLALATIFLISCNSGSTEPDKNTNSHQQETKDDHQTNETDGLKLNNGNKWKSDSSTAANVANMLSVAMELRGNAAISLSNYRSAGIRLQNGVDKLISECRMKGEDHDALHLWLTPLLKEIKELNDSPNTETADEHFNKVYRQLTLYNEYFGK